MSEYVVELPESGAADECIRVIGCEKKLYGYELREEIVRCRDCKHYDEIIHACDHPNVTPLRGDCPENWIFSCFDNDFCCWGERKGEDA